MSGGQTLTQADTIPNLVGQLAQSNRAALSRLLTLAAAGEQLQELTTALHCIPKSTQSIIALTGSAGVGKSSLLGAVVNHFAQRGEFVGVLACDPESPVTGGALLGDRCRIAGNASSERVFIRSLSTVAGQQGVARNIDVMLDLMRAFKFDRIFVETVGAGQGDTAVRKLADLVVLVLQPQTGDELQWEKAGILEIADVVVVNKSDLPGNDQTVADVSQHLPATGARRVPVVSTSVARNKGIEELCQAIVSAVDS